MQNGSWLTVFPVLSGEKLVNFLAEPKPGTKWPSNLPKFESRQDAIAVCKELCKLEYILRCEKRGKGELGVSEKSMIGCREMDWVSRNEKYSNSNDVKHCADDENARLR